MTDQQLADRFELRAGRDEGTKTASEPANISTKKAWRGTGLQTTGTDLARNAG
jgi:hypothetical protein